MLLLVYINIAIAIGEVSAVSSNVTPPGGHRAPFTDRSHRTTLYSGNDKALARGAI